MNQALLHMVMQEELNGFDVTEGKEIEVTLDIDTNAQMELIIKNHSGKEILKYKF